MRKQVIYLLILSILFSSMRFERLEQLIPSECQDVYLKALEMEKQQMVKAYYDGKEHGEEYNKRQSRD